MGGHLEERRRRRAPATFPSGHKSSHTYQSIKRWSANRLTNERNLRARSHPDHLNIDPKSEERIPKKPYCDNEAKRPQPPLSRLWLVVTRLWTILGGERGTQRGQEESNLFASLKELDNRLEEDWTDKSSSSTHCRKQSHLLLRGSDECCLCQRGLVAGGGRNQRIQRDQKDIFQSHRLLGLTRDNFPRQPEAAPRIEATGPSREREQFIHRIIYQKLDEFRAEMNPASFTGCIVHFLLDGVDHSVISYGFTIGFSFALFLFFLVLSRF